MTEHNTIDYYMNLPYTLQSTKDAENHYIVAVKELPGCKSEGNTLDEAYDMIESALKCWLEVALDKGGEIPMPASMKDNSTSPFLW